MTTNFIKKLKMIIIETIEKNNGIFMYDLFCITSLQKFKTDLAKYFNKFESFLRQLNMYDVHYKILKKKDFEIVIRSNFLQENNSDLLDNLRPRTQKRIRLENEENISKKIKIIDEHGLDFDDLDKINYLCIINEQEVQ